MSIAPAPAAASPAKANSPQGTKPSKDAADSLIQQRIDEACSALWWAELTRTGLALLIGLFVALLVWIVLDQWIYAGGKLFRTLALATLAGWVGWTLVKRVMPVLKSSVRPEYAARSLERDVPTLRQALTSYITLRGDRGKANLRGRVVNSIGSQAAGTLRTHDHLPAEATGTMRWWLFTMVAFAVLAGYAVLSPKNSFVSAARLLIPFASIDPPRRVSIAEVNPGDSEAIAGRDVTVSASIIGMTDDEQAVIRWETGAAEHEAPLDFEESSLRHQGSLTLAHSVSGSVPYYIEAGDAIAGPFHLQVQDVPVVAVDSIHYQPPAYTGEQPHTNSSGAITGVDGTVVTINATTNRAVAKGKVEFNPKPIGNTVAATAGAQALSLDASGTKLTLTFTLRTPEGRSAEAGLESYRIKVWDDADQSNPDPIIYPIRVIADLPPEISVVVPQKSPQNVPLDAQQSFEIHALDADYGLKSVRLKIMRSGRVLDEPVLWSDPVGASGNQVVEYGLRPKKLGLRVGERVRVTAIAIDNRFSETDPRIKPNVTTADPIDLRITAPEASDPDSNDPNSKQDPANQEGGSEESEASTGSNQEGESEEKNNDSKDSGDSGETGQSGNEGTQGGGSGSGSGDSESEGEGEGNAGGSGPSEGENESPDSKGSGGSNDGEGESSDQNDPSNSGGAGGTGDNSEGEGSNSPENEGASESEGADSEMNEGAGNDSQSGSDAQSGTGNQPSGDATGDPNAAPESGAGDGQSQSDAARQQPGGDPDRAPENDGQAMERLKEFLEQKQKEQQSGSDSSTGQDSSQNQQPSGEGGSQEQTDQGGSSQSGSKPEPGSNNDPSGGTDSQQPDAGSEERGNEERGSEGGSTDPQGNQKGSGNQDQNSTQSQQNTDASSGQNEDRGQQGTGDQNDPKDSATGDQRGSEGANDPSKEGSKGDQRNEGGSSERSEKPDGSGSDDSNKKDPTGNDPKSRDPNSSDPNKGEQGTGGQSDAEKNRQPGDNQDTGDSRESGNDAGSENGIGDTGQSNNQSNSRNQGTEGEQADPSQGEQSEGEQNNPGNAADPSTSTGDSQSNPSEAQNPSDDNQASSQNFNGSGSGGEGTAKEGDPDVPPDPIDTEYAKQATDLVLDYLDQTRDAPDRDLLEKMNWTEQDLNRFYDRWQKVRQMQRTGDAEQQRDVEEALKSLGMRDPRQTTLNKRESADRMQRIRDAGNRRPVPAAHRDAFNEFRRAISRQGR